MTHALALLAAVATSVAPRPELAFRLAARGDLADASGEAGRVLAASPADPVALLVEACVALERNDVERAAALAGALEAAGSPRAPVLRRLAARRRARPGEPMRVALAEAWKATGAPDLSKDGPSPAALGSLLPPLGEDALGRLAPAERVALEGRPDVGIPARAGGRAAEVERLVAAAATARTNPLWVNLLLLASVRAPGDDPPELWARVAEAERRLAEAASSSDPRNGYYRLIGVVAGGAEGWKPGGAGMPALSPRDLDVLEAALAGPRFVWPWGTIRQHAIARLREIDPAHGELRGALLSMQVFPLWPVAVGWRAARTEDPGSRARAARVLAKTARHLADSPVLLERMISGTLDANAAALSGSAARIEKASARRTALGEWQQRLSAAAERLGTWPLVSVWRETGPEGEVAWLERLAR